MGVNCGTIITSKLRKMICKGDYYIKWGWGAGQTVVMHIGIGMLHSVTIVFRKVKGSMVSKNLVTQLLFEHSLARFTKFLGQVVTSSA